ncbi:MAG: GntR family transcriptional regulator, partial [Candidatus Aminicenantaceae bacterium]
MKKELHPPIYKIPKTLSQSIYYYLKDAILKGKYKARTKINEKEIAEIFEVSRTPVREAIVKLAAEGFIEITSHRESAVKEVSFKELSEIFQVIAVLDSFASALVIDNISSSEFLKLKKMTNKMEYYLHQNDVENFININYAIHNKMWDYLTNINSFLQKKLRDSIDQIKMDK